MNQSLIADKIELTELANKLFMYTDLQQWQRLLDEVFVNEIWFDASSAGAGAPSLMPAKAVCEMWQRGLTLCITRPGITCQLLMKTMQIFLVTPLPHIVKKVLQRAYQEPLLAVMI